MSITPPEPVILLNNPMLYSAVEHHEASETAAVAVAKQPEPSSPLQPGTSPVTAKLARVEVPWEALMNGMLNCPLVVLCIKY